MFATINSDTEAVNNMLHYVQQLSKASKRVCIDVSTTMYVNIWLTPAKWPTPIKQPLAISPWVAA